MSGTSIDDLVKALSSLTILEAADLAKKLEEEWGVSAAAPMVAAVGAPAGDAEAGKAEESSTYLVILKEIGSEKIKVVKEVRTITNLGLFDAKSLVDSVADEPQQIKQQMPKEEAEEIKKKLEAVGAKVELKAV